VTPPAEKKPEEIEREMHQTRESLTQKVAALEQTVTGNIQTVTDTVDQVKSSIQDTVANVKDTVQDTVASVKDSLKEGVHTVADTVKESLDFSAHVRARPWLSVGVSAAAGFLTGFLIGGGSSRRSLGATSDMPEEQARGYAPPPPSYAASAPRSEPSKPGLFDELFGMVSREVRQLAETALASAKTAVQRNIDQNVPKLVDTAVAGVMPTGAGSDGSTSGNTANRGGFPARG